MPQWAGCPLPVLGDRELTAAYGSVRAPAPGGRCRPLCWGGYNGRLHSTRAKAKSAKLDKSVFLFESGR